MAGNTALGDWVASTFTPAGAISKGMSGAKDSPDPNQGLTPEEIAARKKKLLAAGQSSPMSDFGNAAMALLGKRF